MRLVLPFINSSKLQRWQIAPLMVLPGTIRIKLDDAINYYSTSPLQKISCR